MTGLTLRRHPMQRRAFMPTFPDLFDRWSRDGANMPAPWGPKADIVKEDGLYKITVELPGVDKDAVEIDVKDNVLTIRGEKKNEAHEEKDGYTYTERSYGAFERSFGLPAGVDPNEIGAGLSDGVLTVTVPAHEPEKKKIEVKAA